MLTHYNDWYNQIIPSPSRNPYATGGKAPYQEGLSEVAMGGEGIHSHLVLHVEAEY
jgi:hypothetical protein